MTHALPQLEHPERQAFAVSVAIHILLFLLLWLFGGTIFNEPIRVAIVVDTAPPEVIEEPETEITPSKKRLSQKKTTRTKKNTSTSSKEGNSQNPWSDYERELFSKKGNTSTQQGSAGKSNTTGWGNEKFGKSEKQSTEEKVTIPKGDTSSATRWRKGAARKLVSLPAIDYPESVRKKSGQGQVELLVEVGPDGRVEEIEILKSSGYTRLDLNAKNAYRNAVFSPSSSGESASGVIVVKFKMRDS